MKTIADLALECGVHRSTLNHAIGRSVFPAKKYGNTILVDEESEQFKLWLSGTKKGRPRKSSAAPS